MANRPFNDYDEAFSKSLLETITETRIKTEEMAGKEKERVFELEKLKLEVSNHEVPETSYSRANFHKFQSDFRNLMPEFVPDQSDISLCCNHS